MWQHTIDMKLMADEVARGYARAGFRVKTEAAVFSFDRLSPAALNTHASGICELHRDAFFVLLALASSKRQGGFVTSIAGLGLMLTDMTTRYQFAGPDPMPSEAYTGSGESPYVLSYPYICAPGTRWKADVIHLSGGGFSAAPGTTAVLFDLSLIGIKLWTVPYSTVVIAPEH